MKEMAHVKVMGHRLTTHTDKRFSRILYRLYNFSPLLVCFPSFVEAHFICSAASLWIFRLERIIFPIAVRTNVMLSWSFKYFFTTTRAWIFITHYLFQYPILSDGLNIVLGTPSFVFTANVFVGGWG